jgi:hypothetical protein
MGICGRSPGRPEDHMKKKQLYTDTGDRFDRSLAYEEIGFTDKPFNFSIVLEKKRNRRNSSRKYLMGIT